ncbi:PIN domain-containing protein [Streptomyces scabiei]|uniref:PIN domain-containing protein n=1 Tax=Streptomyces scabiei TaxID=1930 RepID=UPI0029AE70FA|nr:PIN domain-containing protein [Streptomyces scabiei]MDX3175307.1 PIN domain-containing protein [Streptomyces scabiei]
MLITPRPGAHHDNLRKALSSVHTAAKNLPGSADNAFAGLLKYLQWATESARMLRSQISAKDLDSLIFTPRYQTLLASCGTLAGSSQQSLVRGLVELEVTERVEALEAAIADFEAQTRRWDGQEMLVVADTSFYCHNPQCLRDADLHEILDLRPTTRVRLLFPVVVVDELDGLKEAGKQQARWRAPHTLGLLDEVLRGGTFGVWRLEEDFSSGNPRGRVSMEIVLDPPGHVRLPIADDEIIDRAVAIQALAGRPVRLLTCDTSQHTRGCAAGLQVTKVVTKDPGPEPDWEAQNRPGNGTRAKRRARQDEAEAGQGGSAG